jgi:hypothetical protein
VTERIKTKVLVWAITDVEDVAAAIGSVREQYDVSISVIADPSHVQNYQGVADKVIPVSPHSGRFSFRLWSRLAFARADLNVIPCAENANHYYVVAPAINALFFLKRKSAIALYMDGNLSVIPIQSQSVRPFVLWPVLLAASVVAIFPFLAWAVLGVFLFSAGVYAVEKIVKAYLYKYQHVYYGLHLSFKREEATYVSHGWMHPFDEGYFNRLVFSREGPVSSKFDVGSDFFPIYNPRRGSGSLHDQFAFVNTHDKPLDEPKKTIFVVGGSVAQSPVGDPTAYHLVLEDLLRRNGHDFHVIPWAIGGYQSTQARVLTELSLIALKPFAIVNLDFYNDAHFAMMGVPPGETIRSQRKYLSAFNPVFKILSPLFDHSVVARHLWQKRYTKIMISHMSGLMRRPDEIALAMDHCISIYMENIRRIHRICEAEGVHHAAFIQPLRDDFSIAENKARAGENPKAQIMNLSYKRLHRRLEKEDSGQRIFVRNPVFPATDFIDEVHFNENGQRKMAQHMENVTQSWLTGSA